MTLRAVASGGSSGITVGNAVTGGGANRVLYEDGSQNLATNSGFTFGVTTGGLSVGSLAVTGTTAPANGWYLPTAGQPSIVSNTQLMTRWANPGIDSIGNMTFNWMSSATDLSGSRDLGMARGGPGQIVFGTGNSPGAASATSRAEINKAVTAIVDATPTATFTVTIPNAAHSAMVKVTLVGSLGAGGAIGANEASATISYDIAICRTAGVNAVATISSAYGSAASAVSGAATVTITAALSAIAGAVGVANTFTVNVTITKSGGASANHTCQVYGRLLNANASGVTIA